MPLYDMRCTGCGLEEERLVRFSERDKQVCRRCEAPMRVIFRGSAGRYHPFPEGWWEHLDTKPIYIRNKRQLREECRRRGLSSQYLEDL